MAPHAGVALEEKRLAEEWNANRGQEASQNYGRGRGGEPEDGGCREEELDPFAQDLPSEPRDFPNLMQAVLALGHVGSQAASEVPVREPRDLPLERLPQPPLEPPPEPELAGERSQVEDERGREEENERKKERRRLEECPEEKPFENHGGRRGHGRCREKTGGEKSVPSQSLPELAQGTYRLLVPRGGYGLGKRDRGGNASGSRGPQENGATEEEISILRTDGPEFLRDCARVRDGLLEERDELRLAACASKGGIESRQGTKGLVGHRRLRETRGRFRGDILVAESAGQEGETFVGARPLPPVGGGNGHHVLVELFEELLPREPAPSVGRVHDLRHARDDAPDDGEMRAPVGQTEYGDRGKGARFLEQNRILRKEHLLERNAEPGGELLQGLDDRSIHLRLAGFAQPPVAQGDAVALEIALERGGPAVHPRGLDDLRNQETPRCHCGRMLIHSVWIGGCHLA